VQSGPGWWAPRQAQWWTAVLFVAGSACFLIGPLPGLVQAVGAVADAAVFFAGSIAFTAASALQLHATPRADRIDRLVDVVQLAGTLFFNLSTWRALQTTLDNEATNRLIWRPDFAGSVCFLVASFLACRGVARHTRSFRIAALNMIGSVAFGVSAVASYVVPDTGDVLDLAAANFTTALGALCFLVGALLLLPAAAPARPAVRPQATSGA
jgi:hypothetical protein